MYKQSKKVREQDIFYSLDSKEGCRYDVKIEMWKSDLTTITTTATWFDR